DQYLRTGAPKADTPPVLIYNTGENHWDRLKSWPLACEQGCAAPLKPLYLQAAFGLGFGKPADGGSAADSYVSDPAKPVPFRSRPIAPPSYLDNAGWRTWLTTDQREASGRPDVATFTSDILTAPVKIAGQPVANLIASTSGTDSDWVVKLIDVYPDEVASDPPMGGYQLMIAADIFRGRYRESLETPRPIAAGKPLRYRFNLPTANHVFLPGHRIMVQVQSSWFPLYDRNPQTFVPNIFWARPADYRKATQRIYHAPDQASFIELPIVAAP
ncbi:MAG TPA: CocE/NonD family hydrolase, partial [Kofleriaceae bacterium]|nr:CocE/NonD family hydrolase [Kofleriaceae bacterium]